MKNLIFILLLLPFSFISAQKVGLVLSGGGAKGFVHVGVIKALEETGIPIDYITGTSMGAIVGSLYAMGMTPDDMIQLFKSQDFRNWSTGEVDVKFNYNYLSSEVKPEFVDLPLKVRKTETTPLKLNYVLPTNIVSSRQMNFAFLTLFSQATAICRGNFNNLFVPFRCVASDVYKKESVVLRNGDLGSAVRASMTFPFVYKPISINGDLLFDGGIYNNFPANVMKQDFHPDFIIGSKVANNPSKADAQDVMSQVQNMIVSPTNFNIDKKEGFLLNFKLSDFKVFDFSKVDELVKIGYDYTISHLNEIKKHIKRKNELLKVNKERKEFRSRFPELRFQKVIVEGVDSLEAWYVEKTFHAKNELFNLQDFKESYFRLVSDNMIMEVLPKAVFDSTSNNFDLILNVKTQKNLHLKIGGHISSTTSNEAYFGLFYKSIKSFALDASLEAQFGLIYNSLGVSGIMKTSGRSNLYFKTKLVVHEFDYYKGIQVYYQYQRVPLVSQFEAYAKFSGGLILGALGKLEAGIGYGVMTDYNFYEDPSTNSTHNNKTLFSRAGVFGHFESYNLDNASYPTKGHDVSASLHLYNDDVSYQYNKIRQDIDGKTFSLWLAFRAKSDFYFQLSDKWRFGLYAELALTNRKLLNSYTASVIQAPDFRPTPFTKTTFNEGLSASQFGAIGVKPIYFLNPKLQIRWENYWFVPYKAILRTPNNEAYYSTPFRKTQFISEASLVYNFKFASIGLYANYLTVENSRINWGLNIGYLLFNGKFLE